ncbi:MAG TPA: M23 family metallopeptidase, partial [Caldilineaceae bacterium]|nr:M23 family metallopeptidase [Caldilineaceae bacterium]
MLRNLPLTGEFPVLQNFGDNPKVYTGVRCGEVALRGHNGIDFATPLGTPVLAVQDGTVLAARTDAGGFGQFALLGHEWGQSLYAQLGELKLSQGQTVSAGQQIGLSGNSGLSSAPHLHFGLRIHPFSLADGWCGYVD